MVPKIIQVVNTVADWRLVSLDTYIYIYVCVFTRATCTMHTLILFLPLCGQKLRCQRRLLRHNRIA